VLDSSLRLRSASQAASAHLGIWLPEGVFFAFSAALPQLISVSEGALKEALAQDTGIFHQKKLS
jgi:hypothetical protein